MNGLTATTQFKVGEWVFCEFALSQILGLSAEGCVNEVTDGVCRHFGFDLSERCMPLTLDMKQIADHFAWVSKEIHQKGSYGLNYPDIHRWLVNHWVQTCEHAGDTAAMTDDYKLLSDFHVSVLDKQNVDSGYGFPLMRPR